MTDTKFPDLRLHGDEILIQSFEDGWTTDVKFQTGIGEFRLIRVRAPSQTVLFETLNLLFKNQRSFK